MEDLTHSGAVEAVVLEVLTERLLALALIAARHERCSRGATDSTLTIRAIEYHAGTCQLIDVRGLTDLVSVAPQGVGAKIVGDNEEDVPYLRRVLSVKGERCEAPKKSEEGKARAHRLLEIEQICRVVTILSVMGANVGRDYNWKMSRGSL